MKSRAVEIFSEVYDRQPQLTVLSPGRINLIGEHIDYYGGLVMPAAIDKYVGISLGASNGYQSSVYSFNYNEKYLLDTNEPEQQPSQSWIKYLTKALSILLESGFKSKPFDIIISSNLSTGAGLSSSAALVTGFVEILSEYNDWNIAYDKIALIAQTTEHRLGISCGLMDQYASLFGKKDSFILLDCSDLKFKEVKVNLNNYILRLFNTKVHHALTDGGYAKRRKQGEAALDELKSFYSKPGSFRDFSVDELEHMPAFDDIQSRRARHAITEIKRVKEFENAVNQNDFERAGNLMYLSHQSLKFDYQVSCDEADYIVNVAKLEGVAGARIMGGGFGGCVLCLLEKKYEQTFKERLVVAYKKKFGFEPEPIDFSLGQRQVYHTSNSTSL